MNNTEKTLIKNVVEYAINKNDLQDLKNIAKNSDYALEIIIDKLLEHQNTINHIKNILK